MGLALLLTSRLALAYEGAAEPPPQEQPQPKAPQLTKPPSIVHGVMAAYPPALLGPKAPKGTVHLVIEIDASGHVPNATVSQSSGFPAMDESALTAIRQFLFSPAELDGKPAAIRLEYVFNFEPPPPPPPPVPSAPPPPPPVNLSGRVLERGTRDPLPGATVSIPEANLEADADAQGRFEIRGVPLGKVRIRIEEPSHDLFTTTEDIQPGKVTELTAYIWKRIDAKHSSTVHGDREKKEVALRTLEQQELTTAPGSMGDPVRVIEDLPGVARPPYDLGQLIIRGASPDDTGSYIDGVPVPTLFHFAGGPSVINPALVDHMDFYAGGFGAQYGRAIGGVVDVSTKQPDAKGYHGNVTVDLVQSSAYVEGPLNPNPQKDWGTLAIAGRRSYIDTYLSSVIGALQSPGSATVIAAPRYWDYQIRWALKRKRDTFEAMLFGSDDRFVAAESGAFDSQGFSVSEHDGFNRLLFRWKHKFDDGWIFTLTPVIGDGTVNGGFMSIVSADVFAYNLNLRAKLSRDFSDRFSLTLGLDSIADFYQMTFHLPEIINYRPFPASLANLPIVNYNMHEPVAAEAVYVEAVWNPWRGLKIIPGVRLELYEIQHQVTPVAEPRILVRYEFTPRTAVKAAFGLYHEAPTPASVESQFGYPLNGLPQATHTVLGFEQKFTDTLSLDVQGYYNWRTHLVPDPNLQAPTLTIGQGIDNNEFGRSYGVEILLKQALTARMYGWISYTLARSEEWNFLRHAFQPYPFDQTHLLTIVASYKFNWGIQAGVRYRFTSGRPDYPIVGSTLDSDLSTYMPVTGPFGAVRDPNFSQLDIRIDKVWTFKLWRFSVYLDIQNVLNSQNPEFVIWDYRYAQSAPVRGLPILPTLGVSGSF